MLIRVVERVLEQAYVRTLHRTEHGLELGVPQPLPRSPGRRRVDAPPPHVYDADEPHACVGLEAVGGEAVVDGLEEAKVARQADAGDGVALGAEVEDVDGGGEEERELEGGADGREGVGGRVVGREDGDVEGVVLFSMLINSVNSSSSLSLGGKGERSQEHSYITAYDA